MLKLNESALWLTVFVLVAATGCGGQNFQAVSGKVTFDGKPLANAEVVFAPMETEQNGNPGPASFGVTDENGNFSLATQTGIQGAIVTRHRVGITVKGPSEEEISAKIDEALPKNRSISEKEFTRLEKAARAQFGKSITLPESYNLKSKIQFDVPAGGTSEANFELKSDGS